MLELKNITKDYPAGNGIVSALKGISLSFRKSEFVSILGQSGCGKTTTLNIIGGLDQYTSGDLIINGVSTKNFRDRDWDAYRNHSIGFVFQSYNLIPHQSVLQNVELALSLSGVSKIERRKRAIAALEQVGLGDQLKKKPGEMSGGQMQRVAIARAIVNNPDIILADEPTGALDTETSVQVMDILKEISKDRLVIMVTHNPDIAEKYSTRIIRMLDGVITSDSNPLTEEQIEAEKATEPKPDKKKKRKKMPSMSFFTSFGLSLKNLFTKKGRTTLTAFAGSIGIIGIALIYAVSNGMTTYINAIQEETLSSYPLTLEATHIDMGTLMETFMGKAKSSKHENDAVYQKAMVYYMLDSLNSVTETKNDLNAFKKYIEKERKNPESPLHDAVNGVQYTYDFDMMVYTKNVDGNIIQSDTKKLLQDILLKNFGMDVTSMIGISKSSGMEKSMESMSSMSPMGSSILLWEEMLPGDNGKLISPILEKQYDVIYGSWPTEYNEVVLVLDEFNELDDMTLYALGLKPKEDIDKLVDASINKLSIEPEFDKWSYEEICDMDFRTVMACDCYKLDEETGNYIDLRETDNGLAYLYENGTVLKVSGIIRPNEDANSPMLKGSIAYTSKLTEYVIEKTQDSEAIQKQLENPDVDIFNGLPFKSSTDDMTAEEKKAAFKKYVKGLTKKEKAELYIKIASTPSQEQIDATVEQTMASMPREAIEAQLIAALTTQMSMDENAIQEYLSKMSDDELADVFGKMIAEQFKAQYAQQVMQGLATLTTKQLVAAFNADMKKYSDEQFEAYHDEMLEYSESDLDTNKRLLGVVDIESPSSINLFASTFDNKQVIEDEIAAYNDKVENDFEKINYTDYVGIIMSSVTTIIDAITYVLIAFVAVSLIVSSIMIGVITLISVQERTKEIGILRAIGASKANVSSMFNAETVIIGFTSGLIGVGLTYVLCIPINAILHKLTGIGNLSAALPVTVALILIAISVLLTLISGIIPSRSAAKKDPVVALRSE